jgi:hypothetical protein
VIGQQRDRQIVQDAGDGGAGAHQAPKQSDQICLVRWVEVGGRLVQQQDGCLDGERAGQKNTLSLAARELVQPALLPPGALGIVHRAVDNGLIVGACRGEEPEPGQPAEPHDFAYGELTARVARLGQPGDLARTVARRPLGQGLSVQLDGAPIGFL